MRQITKNGLDLIKRFEGFEPEIYLDAAGLPIPEIMQGRSILPLAQKREMDWPDEMFVQISEAEVGRAVRTRRWKYGVTAPHKDAWEDADSDRYIDTYLYDLLADPYELNNLIEYESHNEVKHVMRERLLRRMAEAGESTPTIELVASVRSAGQRTVSHEEAMS